MKRDAPVDRKLEVMNHLWEQGPASLRELERACGGEAPGASARTAVRALEAGGYLRAAVEEGAHRYHPTLTRRELGRKASRRVLRRYFRGSVASFLDAVAAAGDRSEEEVRELWRRLRGAAADAWLMARSV